MIGTVGPDVVGEVASISERVTGISNGVAKRSTGATSNTAVLHGASFTAGTTSHVDRGAVLR